MNNYCSFDLSYCLFLLCLWITFSFEFQLYNNLLRLQMVAALIKQNQTNKHTFRRRCQINYKRWRYTKSQYWARASFRIGCFVDAVRAMIAPGVRVSRGPDWIWQNQGRLSIVVEQYHVDIKIGFYPKTIESVAIKWKSGSNPYLI